MAREDLVDSVINNADSESGKITERGGRRKEHWSVKSATIFFQSATFPVVNLPCACPQVSADPG